MKRFGWVPQAFFNTGDAGAGAASQTGGAGTGQAAAGAAAAGTGDGAAAAAAAAPGAGSAADANAGAAAAAAAAAAAPGGAAGDGAAAAAAAAGGAAAAQVPDRYELTIPQGSPLDQTDVETITALARENKWDNAAAQAALQRVHDDLSAQSQRFLTELQTDTEVGGDNLAAAQANAARALDRFLPATTEEGQQLRAAMNKSGYGNYRPLVKLLARIGKAMGEDSPTAGNAGLGGGAKRSHADVLFGDSAGVAK